MAATTPPCPMCNDKKGLGAPPKPDQMKKVLASYSLWEIFSDQSSFRKKDQASVCVIFSGGVSKMFSLHILRSHHEHKRQIFCLHHRSTGQQLATMLKKWPEKLRRYAPTTGNQEKKEKMSPRCSQDVPKMSPRCHSNIHRENQWTESKLKKWVGH